MNDDNGRPMATYRLQFNHDFRLTDAQALVPYFSRLGVTHAYASPILRARQASTHGYDVVDPKTVNPAVGDETDFINLVTDLRKLGLGLVLDLVPNHMAATIENPYWRDVLTYGPSSPFAGWFDIDWRMPDADMWGRVFLPVLGEPRTRVLEHDQIRLVWSDGRFVLQYFDHAFPVEPASVSMIGAFGLPDLKQQMQQQHPALESIEAILERLKALPKLATRLRRHMEIDRDQTEQWLSEFAQLVHQSPRIEQWAEETARRFGQGDDGRRRLKKLLDSQPYRLVHWRAAARTINYRRFFDINELISIRQEDPQVFDETHAAVLRWVHDHLIDGLRIDHIDGLRDPLRYLQRLTEALANGEGASRRLPVFVEKILAADESLPPTWPVAGTTGYEFLNQVEAVFVSPEGFAEIEQQYRRLLRRRVDFQQFATWGKRRVLRSDLSPQVSRLADTLMRLAGIGGTDAAESGPASDSKPIADSLQQPSEHASGDDASGDDASGDDASGDDGPATAITLHQELTKRDFVDAIVEVIAALPVYRTYVDSADFALNEADRQYVQSALHAARSDGRAAPEAINFLGQVLLLQNQENLPKHVLHQRVNFIERFQQLSGPAAAKGIEDTALYGYVPLVSLNEVGGEPHLPDDPVAKLHQANEQRATVWPRTMLCVTTHDTKRTADVRGRLDVLSELPKLWFGFIRRWHRANERFRILIRNKQAPDVATEYLFYQSLVGIWPAPSAGDAGQLPDAEVLADLCKRLEQYMLKAVREAKTHSSWTDNNKPFEDAVVSFIRGVLLQPDTATMPLLTDVQKLVSRIARPGFWNSLSRTLIQFTAPGTPDLYQGDELWNFALVDPDNRRSVDYDMRQRLVDDVATGWEGADDSRREFIANLVELPEDGRIKLHLIRRALAARRENPFLFEAGRYVSLTAHGRGQNHLLAFARVANSAGAGTPTAGNADADGDSAVIIVPRWTTELIAEPDAAPIGEPVWSDTVVPLPELLKNRNWTCALSGEQFGPAETALPVSRVLRSFPTALLISAKKRG